MKKRVIIGVLLIVLAIGGTIAMNAIKRTYYFDYTNDDHSFRFLTDGTCEEARPGGQYSNRGYYYHIVDNGGRDINPYCATINGTKYFNGMAIFSQIALGVLFIIGACSIAKVYIIKLIKEETNVSNQS